MLYRIYGSMPHISSYIDSNLPKAVTPDNSVGAIRELISSSQTDKNVIVLLYASEITPAMAGTLLKASEEYEWITWYIADSYLQPPAHLVPLFSRAVTVDVGEEYDVPSDLKTASDTLLTRGSDVSFRAYPVFQAWEEEVGPEGIIAALSASASAFPDKLSVLRAAVNYGGHRDLRRFLLECRLKS